MGSSWCLGRAVLRAAVHSLAARRYVVAMSITNEGNFPGSPNTSDGAYRGVEQAIVQGIVLVFFVIVIIGAVRRFRPMPSFA